MNILTVMMLVVELEQLLGRQHLNVLLLIFLKASSNPPPLYRLILAGLSVVSHFRRTLLLLMLQLTGCPLGSIHCPPDNVEFGSTH